MFFFDLIFFRYENNFWHQHVNVKTLHLQQSCSKIAVLEFGSNCFSMVQGSIRFKFLVVSRVSLLVLIACDFLVNFQSNKIILWCSIPNLFLCSNKPPFTFIFLSFCSFHYSLFKFISSTCLKSKTDSNSSVQCQTAIICTWDRKLTVYCDFIEAWKRREKKSQRKHKKFDRGHFIRGKFSLFWRRDFMRCFFASVLYVEIKQPKPSVHVNVGDPDFF